MDMAPAAGDPSPLCSPNPTAASSSFSRFEKIIDAPTCNGTLRRDWRNNQREREKREEKHMSAKIQGKGVKLEGGGGDGDGPVSSRPELCVV